MGGDRVQPSGPAVSWLRISADDTPVAAQPFFEGFTPGWPTGRPSGRDVDLVWLRVPERSDESTCRAVLSDVEQARADRFRSAPARLLFLYGRWTVRTWLGSLLNCAPAEVPLILLPTGKPGLADVDGVPSPWAFNLSHSGERVLVGLHRGGAVGVDVERTRSPRMARELCASYYHPNEQPMVDPGGETGPDLSKFYQGWTLKEAYIKAIGEGLRYPVRNLDFSRLIGGTRRARVVLDGSPWSCAGLSVDPEYAAAVVWSNAGDGPPSEPL